jgi:hypothetical protein
MVAQLSTLANEISHVSLKVGTHGISGGHMFALEVQDVESSLLSILSVWSLAEVPALGAH